MSARKPFNCIFCGNPVKPNPDQKARLASGEYFALGHVGEFVEMAARRPRTHDEARADVFYDATHATHLHK